MTIRHLILTACLTVGLAFICHDSWADQEGKGASQKTSEAGESGTMERPDPDASFELDEQSRKLWSMIQEEHGNLTGEQQRALQTCGELEPREREIPVEKAMVHCYEELKAMAEEQKQASEEESGED